MLIQYGGPFRRVEVPLPGGRFVVCERGGTVDVPDDLAAALCEQPDWVPVEPGDDETDGE